MSDYGVIAFGNLGFDASVFLLTLFKTAKTAWSVRSQFAIREHISAILLRDGACVASTSSDAKTHFVSLGLIYFRFETFGASLFSYKELIILSILTLLNVGNAVFSKVIGFLIE